MTTQDCFRNVMQERRRYQRGTPDHEYRTRAARRYVWIMRRIPVNLWHKLEKAHAQN